MREEAEIAGRTGLEDMRTFLFMFVTSMFLCLPDILELTLFGPTL